ncbi:hypothetical protein HDU99_007020, partial [Rhizoclosmatium hyalinum]
MSLANRYAPLHQGTVPMGNYNMDRGTLPNQGGFNPQFNAFLDSLLLFDSMGFNLALDALLYTPLLPPLDQMLNTIHAPVFQEKDTILGENQPTTQEPALVQCLSTLGLAESTGVISDSD